MFFIHQILSQIQHGCKTPPIVIQQKKLESLKTNFE